jgi:RNA polymerase sigma-70 factor (ECF subfamily)
MKTSQIADQLLIDLLLKKDRQAFEFLYDTYSPALHGSVIDIVAGKELASDVLQKAFITAYFTISSFKKGKYKLYTWMLHIASRISIETLRAIDQWPTASQLQEVSGGISTLLNKMETGPQTVIRLIYFKGHSRAEVARMLDLPIQMVEVLLQKGLEQLQQYINNNCHWK